jgi:dihydropteroate synthase
MAATDKLTLRPLGLGGVAEVGARALSLAGGPLGFSAAEAVLRRGAAVLAREILPTDALEAWAAAHGVQEQADRILGRLIAPRADLAGLALSRPILMGVINVTPDSFYEGSRRPDSRRAIEDGLAMWEEGAEILDVGGESTRPGAEPIGEDEECRRVLPVVAALAEAGARVSIDSRHAGVMEAALQAGARLVNDVTALSGDARALDVVAAREDTGVVLMHMRGGDPRTMQANPNYADVALDIYDYLEDRIAVCEAAGIGRERIAVDPGIGFGKTLAHNLRLLEQLAVFHALGSAVLLGASRKSFIGALSRNEKPAARQPGSLAAVLAGAARGCQIFRVHDVPETRQALKVWQAITEAES